MLNCLSALTKQIEETREKAIENEIGLHLFLDLFRTTSFECLSLREEGSQIKEEETFYGVWIKEED